jgi:hypothetical protein
MWWPYATPNVADERPRSGVSEGSNSRAQRAPQALYPSRSAPSLLLGDRTKQFAVRSGVIKKPYSDGTFVRVDPGICCPQGLPVAPRTDSISERLRDFRRRVREKERGKFELHIFWRNLEVGN